MKFRTTAIALGVAGAIATPMAAQADLYASARIGIHHIDEDDVADLTIAGYASRFGVRSETDLGNGMTGFGRYEWSVDTDGTSATLGNRHAYVGLKGGFGSMTLGRTYHTFYNHVVGPNDNPWNGSGFAMVNYRGRTSNTVSYAGGTDAVTFGASLVFAIDSEEEAPDQIELGASFGIGDMTLGVAAQTTASDTSQGTAANDDPILGVALTGVGGGDFSAGFGIQTQDEDISFLADIAFGSAYLHVEVLESDARDTDETSVALGYTQSLGRKTSAWYEIHDYDSDGWPSSSDEDSITSVRAVLKYDIE